MSDISDVTVLKIIVAYFFIGLLPTFYVWFKRFDAWWNHGVRYHDQIGESLRIGFFLAWPLFVTVLPAILGFVTVYEWLYKIVDSYRVKRLRKKGKMQ